MGYFDDIPVKGSKNTATSTKSTGGYFDSIPKPTVVPTVPLSTKAKNLAVGTKNLGVGIVKDVLKFGGRLATNPIQTAQIATGNKPTEPFSGKFLGRVEPIGRGQDLNANSLTDALGAGFEAFSYMPLVRSGKVGFNTIKNLGKAKVPIASLLGEGAVGGLTGSLGSQMQQLAGKERQDISGKELATATAVGAVLNPLIGVLGNQIGKRFGKPVKKLEITSNSETTKIPVSTPTSRYAEYRKEQGYEPYQDPNTLPTIDMGETPKPTSQLPVVSTDSPLDVFIKNKKALPEPYIPTKDLPTIDMGATPKKTNELPTIDYDRPTTNIKSEADLTYEAIPDMVSIIINKGKNAPELRAKGTPMKYDVPENMQQRAQELEIRREAVQNSPFNSADNRLLFDNQGNVRELGDVKSGNLSRRIEDKQRTTGIEDPTEFASEFEKFQNNKRALEADEAQFRQDLKSQKTSFKSEVSSLEDVARQSVVDDGIISAKAKKISKKMEQESVEPTFDRQTNEQQITEVLKSDQKDIVDIAMGRKPSPGNIPSTSYLAVAKNLADDMAAKGDVSLALELQRSDIGSKTGQSLQSLSIAAKDNIVDIIRDIRRKMEEKVSLLRATQKSREVNKAVENIKQAIESAKGQPVSRDVIEGALSKIICK